MSRCRTPPRWRILSFPRPRTSSRRRGGSWPIRSGCPPPAPVRNGERPRSPDPWLTPATTRPFPTPGPGPARTYPKRRSHSPKSSGLDPRSDGMAKVDVIMPQMGESIAEGTVSKWLKKLGDTVKRDEPILEISTDKVDAEIPSPAAGVLAEIKVGEGKTVPVQTVIAVIETEKSAAATAAAPAPAAPARAAEPPRSSQG